MGVKRSHAEMSANKAAPAAGPSSSPFLPMFEHFRAELDEHHDRRERIIKASRDITAASKKIIFTLQRVRQLGQPLPEHVVKANKQYYNTIATQLSSVSNDLQGLNTYRYGRQISGGCQEWMESASFQHYLETASLISYEDAAKQLKELSQTSNTDEQEHTEASKGVELSPEDYVLGIYDMTGELMRFAITTMATSGSLPTISGSKNKEGEMDVDQQSPTQAAQQRNVLTDMRLLRAELEGLNAGFGPFAKDAEKKMEVMKTSVEKVEKALYGLIVRGAERPKGWMPEMESGAGGRAVEVEG